MLFLSLLLLSLSVACGPSGDDDDNGTDDDDVGIDDDDVGIDDDDDDSGSDDDDSGGDDDDDSGGDDDDDSGGDDDDSGGDDDDSGGVEDPCSEPTILVTAPPTLYASDGTWTSTSGVVTSSTYPLADALAASQPGDVILLDDGVHPGFMIGSTSGSGYNAGEVHDVDICGSANTTIMPPVDWTSDTLAIVDQVPTSHLRFWHLRIEGGTRAAVMFFQPGATSSTIYEGFHFNDVVIDGGYNHETGTGLASKWGVLSYHLADFRWIGGGVNNIKREHAFYFHNNAGDVLIQGVSSRHTGRTFVQVVQRAGEGMQGAGVLTVEDCVIEDCALTDGGSCITVAGHAGGAIIQNNTLIMGANPALDRGGSSFPATGAIVVWAPNDADIWSNLTYQNGPVTVLGNDFEVQDGDRAIGNFGASEALTVRDNRFSSPSTTSGAGNKPIVFDPYTASAPTSANLNNPAALDICGNTLQNIGFVECEETTCPFDMEAVCP
jgi:hypothetical protein